MTKILYLAANPKDTARLRLGTECNRIETVLSQAQFRDFEIQKYHEVQAADLSTYLIRHKPDIVHFSGHSSESGEFIFEDATGSSQYVSVEALSGLFSVLKDNVRCVVLNACYSQSLAEAIAQYIDCVIGTPAQITDDAAICFAVGFYKAIANGRSVQHAFDLGRVEIKLSVSDANGKPQLLAPRNDASNIVFIRQAPPKVKRQQLIAVS